MDVIASIDTDLGTGEKLIQLLGSLQNISIILEIIGSDKLGKYNKNPRLRIQKVENQNKALEFIRRRGVMLTNIGAEVTECRHFFLIDRTSLTGTLSFCLA